MVTSAQTRSPHVLVLLGPTASGKTAVSLEIAARIGAEIISADAYQIYRKLDIGTGKVLPPARDSCPHHLIDICDPEQEYSAGRFQLDANRKIADILARGRLPIVVGGTPLYIRSLIAPFHSLPKRDKLLTAELEAAGHIHARLAKLDPQAAQKLHPGDTRRVIRALEVCLATKSKISALCCQKIAPSWNFQLVGLAVPRHTLIERISTRVDSMISAGLVTEVRALLEHGLPREAQSLQGIGYQQLWEHLDGKMELARAVELIKRDTRRFAKRQMTFYRSFPEVKWIEAEPLQPKIICEQICRYLHYDLA